MINTQISFERIIFRIFKTSPSKRSYLSDKRDETEQF